MAFIHEFTHEPILINNEEIHQHIQTIQKESLHFEVFRSPTREYILEGNTQALFCLEEMPVTLPGNIIYLN